MDDNELHALIIAKKVTLSSNGSIAAKVQALSAAGFTNEEIDRIVAIDGQQAEAAKEEYNQQVEETLQFIEQQSKWGYWAAGIFLTFIAMAAYFTSLKTVKEFYICIFLAMSSGVAFIIFSHIKAAPIVRDKARYFLKK